MFRTPLCPSSGASQLHMQSLVPCGAWFVVSSSPPPAVTTKQDWRTQQLQHSRTGGHNEPSTKRDQRLNVQLRSSWWWTQWCPKHVERNNVNKILRIFKQSTSMIFRFFIPCIFYTCYNKNYQQMRLFYYVFISFFSSFPYMFRAFMGQHRNQMVA